MADNPEVESSSTAGRCTKCSAPLDDHRFQQVLILPGKYVATTDDAFDCAGAKKKQQPPPNTEWSDQP